MKRIKSINSYWWIYSILAILYIAQLSSCDNDAPKPSASCTLNTIAITLPGTIYTAHYNSQHQITEISNCCVNGWIGTTYQYNVKGNLISANNWTFTYNKKSTNSNRQTGNGIHGRIHL